MNFLSELKKRNVFKVAVAYLALGWVVVQITDIVVPALKLPEALNSIVVYIGIVGFPFALFFTWAFELTTEGVRPTSEVAEGDSNRASTGKKIKYIIVGLMAIAIIFLLFDINLVERENTIAVMPFADMSRDGDQEYFGDGISEEILNVLVRIDGLDVTSRTSSFAFKDQNLLTPEIAERLGVNYILEGSIRSAGNRVRVTAQLIEVESDKHLWSNSYDRELTDIFDIQDEISRSIVDALRIKLVGGEKLREVPTENMDAYTLYLRGHQLFLERGTSNAVGNISNLEQASELLEQATALDGDFADAWADLAASYMLLPGYTGKPDVLGIFADKATAAAERAINLRPNLSQAWATKGFIHLTRFEFEDAELALIRATELNPKNESAWIWLGIHYRMVGNFDNAMDCAELAIDLVPNFAVNYFVQSRILHSQGEVERARAQFDNVVNVMGYERGRFEVALVSIGNNEPEKALTEIKARRRTLFGEDAQNDHLKLYIDAFYDSSLRDEAMRLLQQDMAEGKQITSFGLYMLQDGQSLINKYETYSGNNAFNFARLYFPLNRSMFKQQVVKDFIVKIGLLKYWRSNQFPYFCRPVGADDFECQNGEGKWP